MNDKTNSEHQFSEGGEVPELTKEQTELSLQKLLDRFKQDPQYDMERELGTMLMRHIDSFTPSERNRYDELIKILTIKT